PSDSSRCGIVRAPPPVLVLSCPQRRVALPGMPPWERGRAESESAAPWPASGGARGAAAVRRLGGWTRAGAARGDSLGASPPGGRAMSSPASSPLLRLLQGCACLALQSRVAALGLGRCTSGARGVATLCLCPIAWP